MKQLVVTALPVFQTEAKVGKIEVAVGDVIGPEDVILNLEGGKGGMAVKAGFAGTVSAILVREGDTVTMESPLLDLEDAVEAPQVEGETVTVSVETLPGFQPTATVGNIRVKAGDGVSVGDVLMNLEGGKGGVEVQAKQAGTVAKILVSQGDTVEIHSELLTLFPAEAPAPEARRTVHGEVVVLGGGPGGYVAAIRASQRGKKVILIEQDRLGGTCLNRGCIPTKSMVQSTRGLDTVRNSGLFGVVHGASELSMEALMDRKNQVVSTLVSGLDSSMARHNIQVLRGMGYAQDEKTLTVELDTETLSVTFDQLILATGSVVSYPPFPGADAKDNLTSDELLELREIPRSLIILGGRVIAMEFAFIYRKLGCEVTVIQRSDSIFPNMDEDVIAEVRKSALDLGIHLYEGTKIQAIRTTVDGQKLVEFDYQGETRYLTAEKLAVATGRKPNLDGLHLERLHVEISPETRGILVDRHMQTTAHGIYAIGDCTNLHNLAHVASKQGLVAVENILGNPETMAYNAIPEAVFTTPEIGLVGKTEKQCRKENLEILVGKFPYASNGKALVENETQGFVKVIARKSDRVLIGAALVGAGAADLLSAFTNLITVGATVDQAKAVIYAHPTVSETLGEAVMDLDGESIHK